MLNASKLQEIAHANPTAEFMFTAWALRERHRPTLDVRRFKLYLKREGVPINEQHYNETLEKLAAAGFGALSNGPRGLPKFLAWKFPVHVIGKLGMEGAPNGVKATIRLRKATSKPVERKKEPAGATKMDTRKPQTPGGTERITLLVALPSNRTVRLDFPGDLSDADVGTIERGINSLRNS